MRALQPETGTDPRMDGDGELVRREQMAALARQLPHAVAGNLAVAVIAAYGVWAAGGAARILGWFGAMAIVAALRWRVVAPWRGSHPPRADAAALRRAALAAAAT